MTVFGIDLPRLSVFGAVLVLVSACSGIGDSVGEADLPGIYAAAAVELAQLGQVDGVVYFEDAIGELPLEAEPIQRPVLLEAGTQLSPTIRTAITEAVEAVTDYHVEFGADWSGLAREQCDAGRPWGEYVYYRLSTAHPLTGGDVLVLVELNDVNSPTWEEIILTRTSEGWQATKRTPSGYLLFSPADSCL